MGEGRGEDFHGDDFILELFIDVDLGHGLSSKRHNELLFLLKTTYFAQDINRSETLARIKRYYSGRVCARTRNRGPIES